MRPESIRKFDLFYLASIAASTVSTALGFNLAMEQARAEAASRGVEVSTSLVIGSVVVGILLSLLLWYLVSRKAIAIAKWIILLFLALSVWSLPSIFAGGIMTYEAFALLGLSLQIIAVWYLFQPDAKAWFAGDRGDETAETIEPVDTID